jgi:hypothetical protein
MIILWTVLRSLWSKAGLYLIAGLAILTAVATALRSVYKSGQTAERFKQSEERIKEYEQQHEIQDSIDAMPADDVRDELRDRWGKN